MILSVYDINIIAEITVLLASVFVFYKWRVLNPKTAWSFLLFGLTSIVFIILNFYQVSGNTNFIIRILVVVPRIFLLSYGISEMVKGTRPLFYSYLLFILVPFVIIIDWNLSKIYAAIGLVGSIIYMAFFSFLFVTKDRELRFLAFLGMPMLSLRSCWSFYWKNLIQCSHFLFPEYC